MSCPLRVLGIRASGRPRHPSSRIEARHSSDTVAVTQLHYLLPTSLLPILMLDLRLHTVAVPVVLVLIGFLSFSSQLLFSHISPGPLNTREAATFNVAVACLLICYARACLTDPGKVVSNNGRMEGGRNGPWCTRCDAPKPPRSHHCRICKRFVGEWCLEDS